MAAPAFFEERGIEAKRLPGWVLTKAAGIITALETGTHFQAVGGKRMNYNKSTISIPVGPLYRMLAVEEDGILKIKRVMSHEDYNKYAKKVRL